MSTDAQIEAEIQAKGLTAPRITPADIEANIASEHIFNAGMADVAQKILDWTITDEEARQPRSPLDMVTICVLVLRNGHRIVGVNEGPVSAANFDAELGRKLARQKAVDQIWPLMGYELKERLYQMDRAPHPLDRA